MIHPAKLPMTRDVASLHVHPDAAGAVATDPERSGWRYLSFRAFGLGEGESVTLEHPEHEAAIRPTAVVADEHVLWIADLGHHAANVGAHRQCD